MVEQHVPFQLLSSVFRSKLMTKRGAREGYFDSKRSVASYGAITFSPSSSLRNFHDNPVRRREGFLLIHLLLTFNLAPMQVRRLRTFPAFSSPEFP